ncbi:hypothetical protein JHK82_053843 [Glycine max]|nr:hypothetical protein JHK86_053693 [Glycine max]KAG4928157.1 hypothetical protein JHK85_054643 [Glycine max]KAG5083678.1 hypothetical protein JHK84_053716 [Glycine max]KAG5086446.1 hypothetical protein JHK82_053843 [Glycine max]
MGKIHYYGKTCGWERGDYTEDKEVKLEDGRVRWMEYGSQNGDGGGLYFNGNRNYWNSGCKSVGILLEMVLGNYYVCVMDDNKLNHFHSKCKGIGAGKWHDINSSLRFG